MKKTTILLLVIGAISVAFSSGCQGTQAADAEKGLTASGTLAADEVKIASEIGGLINEILVREGDEVSRGDLLFSLDMSLFLAEKNRAEKGLAAAEAGLSAAQLGVVSAEDQYLLVLQQVTSQERAQGAQDWLVGLPVEINLPGWYFSKNEQLEIVEGEVTAARERLSRLIDNLDQVMLSAANQEFLAAEKKLHARQVAYEIALSTLNKANSAADRAYLQEAAQESYDAVVSSLESAQLAYDREISTREADAILEARARVAAAQSDLDYALDKLTSLQSGDQSLQVRSALTGIALAEANVAQARAGLEQAEAALGVLQVQEDKMSKVSPVAGVILALNIKQGEIAGPGSTLMTIASLEELKLTVYVSEESYGSISLGQKVVLQVDSFPGESFSGEVVNIADQAEFTPRNVQTAEGRKTTVFAVKIRVMNPDGKLKPGMPADVSFE